MAGQLSDFLSRRDPSNHLSHPFLHHDLEDGDLELVFL
jgi:hypothetical protein